MAHLILKEFESDAFVVDHVIETLTYKSTDGRVGQTNFDPLILEDIFKRTIEDLKRIDDKTKQKIDTLEKDCFKEKNECKEKMVNLEAVYNDSYDKLCRLDKRISEVSSNMSEMGSQLENLNKPRHNLNESYKIAKYFDKFMDGIDNSGVFADDSKLEQAADVIYKLHMIAADLTDPKFDRANDLIAVKYDEIEKKLIQKFHGAFYVNEKKSMKKYIHILSNFRGYQDCINEFIKNSQASIMHQKDIFSEILPLSVKMNEIINEVFTNNERIMEQFIKDLFLGKVQNFIATNTKELKETDLEKYLDTIYLYYNKNKKIFKDLAEHMKLSSESTFFTKLMNEVYQVYLKDYVNLEKINLLNKYKLYLERFYEGLGHAKRNFQTFGFVSNLLSKSSASSNPNEVVDEKFLSSDITAVCIDDAKKALNRMQLLCDLNHQSKAVEDVCEIIANTLCKEHFQYALDLHIYAIQLIDTKQQEPDIQLFKTIRKLNNLMYLYERFMNTNALVLVSGTVNHSKILTKQKAIYNEIEVKVDTALEKVFNVIGTHLKHVLQTEQKSSDFKQDEQALMDQQAVTTACSKVVRITTGYIVQIGECFDGKNVNSVLKELGIKYHRCIYDHILRFEYNDLGAITLIKDLNEYRRCAKEFNSHLLDTLFTTLFSLGNLLVVAPGNLQEICAGEHLSVLNKDIIEAFVKLRADNKQIRFQINRPNRNA